METEKLKPDLIKLTILFILVLGRAKNNSFRFVKSFNVQLKTGLPRSEKTYFSKVREKSGNFTFGSPFGSGGRFLGSKGVFI